VLSEKAYSNANRLMSQGKYIEALELASQIKSPALRAAVLIDAGYPLGKSSAVRNGIAAAMEALSPDSQARQHFSPASLWYNLANGHYALFMLRRAHTARPLVSPNDGNARSAKQAYRQAMAHLRNEPGTFKTQVWTNLGNCLSHFGRGMEAIDCYREALREEPANGMAAGNLGVELLHAADITGRYRHDYMLAARVHLVAALGPTMHLRYGGQDAVRGFVDALSKVEEFFSMHKREVRPTRPAAPPSRRKSTLQYIRFCQEHSLFLSAWAGDARDLPARSDEVSLGPIVTSLDDNSTVPELLRILNEIKESFATARYLAFLALSAQPQLSDASALTRYFQLPALEALYGTPLGMLKSAYSQAFDVLDKVARLVNVYFQIGVRTDSFWRVFATRQSLGKTQEIRWIARPAIAASYNFSLYALADLAIDYYDAQLTDLPAIDKRRNRMTHDYLLVLPRHADDSHDDAAIMLGDLIDGTLRTLRLAKYSVLYCVSAIYIAEARKQRRGKTIPVVYRDTPGVATPG